jgi:LPS sulfotransferase NodH
MRKGVKFILLSTQRSGSTWVIDTLNNLNDIKAYGELFLNEKRTWDAGALDFPRFVESKFYSSLRPFSVFSYLTSFYNQSKKVGFKLMLSQVKKHPEILLYCRLHLIRVIHLIRQNHLDIIISAEMKKVAGVAHHLKGNRKIGQTDANKRVEQASDENKKNMVRLDPETLLNRLERMEAKIKAAKRLLRLFQFHYLEIAYEDLVSNPLNFKRMTEFLEVKFYGTPQSSTHKIIRGDHAAVIDNYDEIKKLLSHTKFSDFIN